MRLLRPPASVYSLKRTWATVTDFHLLQQTEQGLPYTIVQDSQCLDNMITKTLTILSCSHSVSALPGVASSAQLSIRASAKLQLQGFAERCSALNRHPQSCSQTAEIQSHGAGRAEWGGCQRRGGFQVSAGPQRGHDSAAALPFPLRPHPHYGRLDLCGLDGWGPEGAPLPVSCCPCHVFCRLLEPCSAR